VYIVTYQCTFVNKNSPYRGQDERLSYNVRASSLGSLGLHTSVHVSQGFSFVKR